MSEPPSLRVADVIRVWESSPPSTWTVPDGSLIQGVRTLWTVLANIVADWQAHAAAVPAPPGGGDERLGALVDAIERLHPRFLQSMLSYIVFFEMVDSGYAALYGQMNALNAVPGLRIAHGKPPRKSEYLETLHRIRNYSIAHWGGTEKVAALDAAAGKHLGFHIDGGAIADWRLDRLCFGGTGVVRPGTEDTEERSGPRETWSLPETHAHCMAYLEEYDDTLARYLTDLKAAMPIAVGTRAYR
jgi:hypothetical protein